jgi:putative peptidoglycan binding protein
MKLFLTLGCCVAIASLALAEQGDQQKKKKRGQQQQQQQQQQPQQQQGKQSKQQQRHLNNQDQHAQHQVNKENRHLDKQDQHAQHQLNQENRHIANQERKAAKFQVRHFDVAKGPKADIKSVTFRENNRILNSEKWVGPRYTVFRGYRAQWHDRDWWRHHHTRIILIGGGWYFWNAGFWFPAWGYDPAAAYYPYDGPIYAYHDLPPDQVVANVQASLQEQGYYQGEVDGLLGPLTRAALADYQRDHGLYTTAAIDEPTLEALGMT